MTMQVALYILLIINSIAGASPFIKNKNSTHLQVVLFLDLHLDLINGASNLLAHCLRLLHNELDVGYQMQAP